MEGAFDRAILALGEFNVALRKCALEVPGISMRHGV